MIFYMTFGQSHPLRNGWVEIEGESYMAVSKKAFEIFGPKFAFIRQTNELTSMFEYFPAGKFGRTLYADKEYPLEEEPNPVEPEDFSGATPGDR